LVILSIFGARELIGMVERLKWKPSKKLSKAIAFCILSLPLAPNAEYIFGQFTYVRPFDYFQGKLTRDQYIQEFRSEYAAFRYINGKLPTEAKILFLWVGNRGYYCDRPYLFDFHKGVSRLQQAVKASHSPEEILSDFQKRGITHFLIRYDLFDRWVKSNFDQRSRDILADFFRRHVKLLFFGQGYGVLILQPPTA
jgi:hypothetical protein